MKNTREYVISKKFLLPITSLLKKYTNIAQVLWQTGHIRYYFKISKTLAFDKTDGKTLKNKNSQYGSGKQNQNKTKK
jgi:hypothetical protein